MVHTCPNCGFTLDRPRPADGLSADEEVTMTLLLQGVRPVQIAVALGESYVSTRQRLSRICAKFGANTSLELVGMAWKQNAIALWQFDPRREALIQ